MKAIIQKFIGILLFLLIVACNQQKNKSTDSTSDSTSTDSTSVSNDQVELSEEQIKTAEIKLGALIEKQMGTEISVNGSTELKPNYFASVSPPANGYVYQINVQEGDQVNKGAVLAILEHPDYIQLQQDFLEASGQYDYLKKELERQKTLSDANVSAKKNYQQTQSDYEMARAKYFATRERLKFIGIQPGSVEAGNIQSRISLRAPINGIVSQINSHKGELINMQQSLFEIIDNSHLFVKLSVFEKNINSIKKGEEFSFTVPSFDVLKNYQGTITGINRKMNQVSKMMEATGSINEYIELVPGLYVEAKIQGEEVAVFALPNEAIVKDKSEEFIFVSQGTQTESTGEKTIAFKMIKVVTGIREDGFTQITNTESFKDSQGIVISGAYYLKSELNKGEGDND
ncbi:efflux RND transporter periplasmic adaptor subunit [Christiangramia sp. LLG6405-1]|uniref:efflux RND transporter periplasmic adaptor subunit n=1 Tax=Christiangramia sp. LLG6405-1 TaxID=3160832 RepID=UPI003869ECA6